VSVCQRRELCTAHGAPREGAPRGRSPRGAACAPPPPAAARGERDHRARARTRHRAHFRVCDPAAGRTASGVVPRTARLRHARPRCDAARLDGLQRDDAQHALACARPGRLQQQQLTVGVARKHLRERAMRASQRGAHVHTYVSAGAAAGWRRACSSAPARCCRQLARVRARSVRAAPAAKRTARGTPAPDAGEQASERAQARCTCHAHTSPDTVAPSTVVSFTVAPSGQSATAGAPPAAGGPRPHADAMATCACPLRLAPYPAA
jgi:hypothetical protein